MQTLVHAAENDENCLYITLEESQEQLLQHTYTFDWDAAPHIEDGTLEVREYDAFELADAVETWLHRTADDEDPFENAGKPTMFQEIEEFDPDRIVLDSLSAIEFAFKEDGRSFRHYLSHLFAFFRDRGITTFVIIETQSLPERITENGQAEFLADGVVLLHRIENNRGLEIYKMRGAGFNEKIVPMDIDGTDGIVVQSDESFFSEQLSKMKSGRKF
jgi:KaiC/GvpD/RAD55 family RecA-like ATPase